jgi:hypothetical protein
MAQAALAVRRAKYEERVGAARGGPESRAWPDEPPWVYRLRPACGAEGVCTQGGIHAQLHQAEPERKNDSGSHVVDVLHEKVTPWRRASERLPLSYRAERGHGLAFTAPYVLTVPGVSLVWAPKLNATFGRGSEKTFTAGAVMSPSVSRWLDWYFFAGGERFDRGSTHDTSFVSELGFRFRWKPTYFEGKLPLLGLRLGLQTTNLRRPREPRLIVEVGSGFL